MKKIAPILICITALLFSCTSTGTPPKSEKLAQALKKEGDAYQNQGDYTTALARLLEAEKIRPNDAGIQNSLGLAYMGKKRYDLAEGAFKKALKLDAEFTEAENNLGAAYLRQEKWDTAIAQFKKVLDNLLYPTPHFPLANLGWASLGKQDYANALLYFEKSLAEEPGFTTSVHGIAQVYLKTGQIDRALDYLHRQLHRTPDAAILHADLALIYERQGKFRQAIKAWQLVLKLVPENSSLARTARENLDKLLY